MTHATPHLWYRASFTTTHSSSSLDSLNGALTAVFFGTQLAATLLHATEHTSLGFAKLARCPFRNQLLHLWEMISVLVVAESLKRGRPLRATSQRTLFRYSDSSWPPPAVGISLL